MGDRIEGSAAAWLAGVADPVRLEIVRRLCHVEQATTEELTRECQAGGRTLRRHLGALVAHGLIAKRPGESDGERPGRPPTHFSLHPAIRDDVRAALTGLAKP